MASLLPPRIGKMLAWTLALVTLAVAFGVVEDAMRDLYGLQGCGEAGPMPACGQLRLAWAGAEVAGVLARVPAIGLGLITAFLWFQHHRRGRAASAQGAGQEGDGTTA